MVTEPNAHSVVLPPAQLELLRNAGTLKTYRPGEDLFVEGDRSDFAAVIEHGKVKVVASEPETGKSSVLALRGAGELVGEFGRIDDSLRSATATALTHVRAHVISSSHLRQLLRRPNDILFTLYKITIVRLRESDRRRLEFGAYAAIDRVGRVLLEFAERHGEPGAQRGTVNLHATQRDLEGSAGVSRKTVARAFREFTAHGVISPARGLIVIRDLALLRAIVNSGQL